MVVGQLASLRNKSDFVDITWANTVPTIWAQAAMNLSIVTACIPGLKRFLASLQSGMSTVAIPLSLELGSGNKQAFDSSRKTGRSNDGGRLETNRSNISTILRPNKSNGDRSSETESARGLTKDGVSDTKDFNLDINDT